MHVFPGHLVGVCGRSVCFNSSFLSSTDHLQKPLEDSQVRDILDCVHRVFWKQFRMLEHELEVSCCSKTKGGSFSTQRPWDHERKPNKTSAQFQEETRGGAFSTQAATELLDSALEYFLPVRTLLGFHSCLAVVCRPSHLLLAPTS